MKMKTWQQRRSELQENALKSAYHAADADDADLMHTIEENNDKMKGRYYRSAQERRAFIGCPELYPQPEY